MAASMARRAVKPLKELESPFLANHSSVLEELYRFTIETVDTVSRKEVWVSSELPSVIQLKLRDIQHAVKEGEKLDSDCFKLAIRNMAREDVENFKNTKYLGWKHYVDSDWTKSVARGVDRTSLKTVFYRQSILYNASDSRLILIPVLHNEHWTLYAFKKSDRKLSILDSLPDSAERHHQIRLQVCDNLNKTMDTAFDMSENDFRSWTHEFPEVPRQANSCDCGFFVFNFMRLWDGHRLVESFRTESRELRKDFLAYILSCKENGATLPTNVASWINDPVELCELLLTWKESLTKKPDEFGSTPLHYLGTRGTAITELILENDTSSGCCADSEGSLPIHVAASKGRLDIIKILLDKCPDCDSSCNALGRTFLHVAVDKEQRNVVEYVCSERSLERILNMRDRNGDTALHLAVRNGNDLMFCALLGNKEVCLSFINKEGCTPLDLAFSSIKPSWAYKQIRQQWIRNDLLVAGADFCTYRWDDFSSRSAAMSEADFEKESERISKSAGLLAAAAVLISTIAFQALSHKKSQTASNVPPEATALYFSGIAIFFCTFAGLPIPWLRLRFMALIAGGILVFAASVAILLVFATGLSLVYPGNGSSSMFHTFFIVAEIYGLAAIVFLSRVIMVHARTRCARLGFRACCCSLFRRRPEASWIPLMFVFFLAYSAAITINTFVTYYP